MPRSDAEAAFEFHHRIASRNPYIWTRSEDEIWTFAQRRQLYAARRTDQDEFLGLCYMARDFDESDWELGGLTVSVQMQGTGMALASFALAHTIVFESSLQNGQTIIACVHEKNDAPLALLKCLGFEDSGEVKRLTNEQAPRSMLRNAENDVVGHIFTFMPDKGLRRLATWFSEELDGTLRPEDLADRLKEALWELAGL